MADNWVELRSDTQTKPTAGMRQAMAAAEVGDDTCGEDPTVNRLEARMAELLGKEAAVFACTATQANQMAVWTHCRRGDELLIDETGHIGNYEAGAPAALSGVSVRTVQGQQGLVDVDRLTAALRAPALIYSPTRLLCLENSTNLGGGRTYPLDQLERIGAWAHNRQLKVHLDGARLFNACLARDYQPQVVAQHADTVTICFSKGLGCPMGAILAGSHEDVQSARRARTLFGGALRQAGIPAAACLYALDHHVARLADDHANARRFAAGVAAIPGIRIDVPAVETNLVFFEIDAAWGTAARFAETLAERGIKMYDVGPQRLRACTHLDVDRAGIEHAITAIRDVLART
ncbi:MAG: aminotransferase class I/II-fold pyridoxal phosphate-dependent enzyme [Planctomycetaceae bacterium]|nr:aminotransferase class I/II-fold pyridoxal phosphate-dependent enzyme [Planctomycetaceae bacterium]